MPTITPKLVSSCLPSVIMAIQTTKLRVKKSLVVLLMKKKGIMTVKVRRLTLKIVRKGSGPKYLGGKKLDACHLVGSYVSPYTCGQVYIRPVHRHHQHAVLVERRVFTAHPLWQRGQDPNLKLNIIVGSEVTCYCISLHSYSCTPHVYDWHEIIIEKKWGWAVGARDPVHYPRSLKIRCRVFRVWQELPDGRSWSEAYPDLEWYA